MQIGVCSKIKEIRQEKNFSQEYMARQLEISQSYYAKIENGKKELSVNMLVQIAGILHINLPQFFEEIPTNSHCVVSLSTP